MKLVDTVPLILTYHSYDLLDTKANFNFVVKRKYDNVKYDHVLAYEQIRRNTIFSELLFFSQKYS